LHGSVILLVQGQADVAALPSPKRLRAGRYKIFSGIPAGSRQIPTVE